ncbi:MAG: hypothetical protein EHM20_15215 [Alphaproteobacteria bacterium]|nr:MAG: hypothetical protein EHM20_15215 [Alphaproteobacteria bacterium]
MNIPKWIKPFFVIAGLYDGILGLIFILMPFQIFNVVHVAPPNHIGYVQFPAMLLIAFAIMFFSIAKDPVKNKNLILYGILLKISYCSVIFFHSLTNNVPSIWVIFGYFDLAFLITFLMAAKAMKQSKGAV